MAANSAYNSLEDDSTPSIHQQGIQEENRDSTMVRSDSHAAHGSVQDTARNLSSVVFTADGVGITEREAIEQQIHTVNSIINKEQIKHKREVQRLTKENVMVKKELECVNRKLEQLIEDGRTKDQRLCDKDTQLRVKDDQLSTKDEQLSAKDQQLSAKDQQLKSKDEQLSAKDEQLSAKDEQLKAKDEHIIAKDQQLKTKDEQLGAKDHQVKDEQLEPQQQRNGTELNAQANKLKAQLTQLSTEIAEKKKQHDSHMAELESKKQKLIEELQLQPKLKANETQGEIVLHTESTSCSDVAHLPSNEVTITAPVAKFVPAKENILGRGLFGKVYRGEFGGKPCAIKILNDVAMSLMSNLPLDTEDDKIQQQAKKSFKIESDCLIRIQHDNIVTLYDVRFYPKGDFPVLIMEKMDCSLTQYFRSKGKDVGLVTQVSICCNIASALDYLQKHGVIHRDLCSDNVLLDTKSSIPVAKVADFGMSKILKNFGRMSATLTGIEGGRTAYYPPEIEEDPESYDKSIDVYMFGVVMTQIAHCLPEVVSKKRRRELIAELSESHIMKRLIKQCVEKETNKRPLPQDIHTRLKAHLEKLKCTAN